MFKYSLAFLSSLLLLSNSVSALNPLSNLDNNLLNIPNKITQSNNVDISKSVYNLSKQITVEITTNNNRGSGTLLSKNNNTYLVLTTPMSLIIVIPLLSKLTTATHIKVL